MRFDLLTEPFISVVRTDGRPDCVSLMSALTDAHLIADLRHPSPLDDFAVYRLLLAFLQWVKPRLTEEERQRIERAEGFPDEWREEWASRAAGRFDLLHPQRPFYQDVSPGKTNKNAVTNLLPELPSGSNVAHFRHTRDYRDGLCLPCCATGLLRWSIYASHGTKGSKAQMPSGIHGPCPTYAMQMGKTLLATVLLNWPLAGRVDGDAPIWDGADQNTPLGHLKTLTWRARRVLLAPPDDHGNRDLAPGQCVWCGEATDRLVRQILFQPGWTPPKDYRPDDPHLLRYTRQTVPHGKSKGQGTEKTPEPVMFSWPRPDKPVQSHRAIWRKVVRGLLQRSTVCGSNPSMVRTSLMAAEQALYKHAAQRLDCLPALTSEVRQVAVAELDWLEQMTRATLDARADAAAWRKPKPPPGQVVVRAAVGEKAKGHAVRSGLSGLSPDAESRLELEFMGLLKALSDCGHDLQGRCPEVVKQWRLRVLDAIRLTVQEAVAPTLVCGPLARVVRLRAVGDAVEGVGRSAERTVADDPD